MYICEKKRTQNVLFGHLLFLVDMNSTPDRNRLSIYLTCRSLSHFQEKQKTVSFIHTRVDLTVNTNFSRSIVIQ